MLTALIMAGGSGQRFWPLSSEDKPKQLLSLFSNKSMIRETVDRILPIITPDRIFVSTNIKQVEGVKKELPFIPEENIIIEPLMKDTAACIGYAALLIDKKFSNSKMIVLASDHLIKEEQLFRDTLELASTLVGENEEKIITLGIEPNSPHTGYGYIEIEKNNLTEKKKSYEVKAFHEKPNLETAENYLEAGNYFWNSGMFIWKTSSILRSIREYMTEHGKILDKLKKILDVSTMSGCELAEEVKPEFEKFKKISIDFGVMEKSDKIEVIPVDMGWNDVGSFTALEEIWKKNKNHTVKGEGTSLIEINSSKNIVIAPEGKVVATLGVDNIIVVDTSNGLLVCDKREAQHIKKIIKEIERI